MKVWKTVKDFENYEVSNYGNVRSNHYSKVRILKQENAKGYLRVSLSKGNTVYRFQVHRLVTLHFIFNNEDKPCVNHIDGNKFNNNVSNLEWCTYSENERHSYDILGKVNPIRKLNESEVLDIRKNCIKGVNHNNRGNVLDFMVKYKVDKKTVLNVLNKKYYGVT